MTEGEKRRPGRPPKAPEKGQRRNYSFRLHDDVREQLIEAAAAANRTLSEEIEWRVSRSFEWTKAFGEIEDWKAQQQKRIETLDEKKAAEYLRDRGWPNAQGTRYGNILAEPASIARLDDGRRARVKRMTSPADGVQYELIDGPHESGPTLPPPPAGPPQGTPAPPQQAAPLAPEDWEERVYRAIRRALRDEREQDLGGEKP